MLKRILYIYFCLISTAYSLETTHSFKLNADFFQHDTEITQANTSSNSSIYRLNLNHQADQFEFVTHYQLIFASASHTIEADNNDHHFFDLNETFSENKRDYAQHNLDRFWAGYSTDEITIRFGRQSVTWGNGLVFNIIDLFNPFSPLAIDKEYKTGTDMLYLQYQSDPLKNWEMLYRPETEQADLSYEAGSSSALRFFANFDNTDLNLLISQHYDDTILGIGLSHPVGTSLWRLDITHTELDDHQTFTSLVTNMDYSWQFLNINYYGFIELYYNPFGLNNNNETPSAELLQRLQRFELFSLYKKNLAAGLNIEIHPLIMFSPSLIYTPVSDMSTIQLTLDYNWQQNLNLKVSWINIDNMPSNQFLQSQPEQSLLLQLSYYF